MRFTRMFAVGCLVMILAGCTVSGGTAGDVYLSADKMIRVVNDDPSLSPRQLQSLAEQAGREYATLRLVLHEDVGRVTVRVEDSGIARHFPPATIRIPSRLIRNSTAIAAHEITHLLSQRWASKVLKEGLASYLQERFGEQRGWPNYRRTLHGAARYWLQESTSVQKLEDAETVLGEGRAGRTTERLAAYSFAGSWVRWLVEVELEGDLDRFMNEIYRTENYAVATGRSLPSLKAKWRKFVVGSQEDRVRS